MFSSYVINYVRNLSHEGMWGHLSTDALIPSFFFYQVEVIHYLDARVASVVLPVGDSLGLEARLGTSKKDKKFMAVAE